MKRSDGLISQIEEKVRKLIDLHIKLNDDYHQLEEENNNLKNIINDQQNTIKELELRINNIAIAKQLLTNKEATEAKRKINELVREIDKCVGLLND